MAQESGGRSESGSSDNALWAVLNGRKAPFVPVAPLFVDSPFRSLVDDRLCLAWKRKLEATSGDSVEVDFETYARFRFDLMCEIIDWYNTPPCWVRIPWTASRREVEGCRVARRGDRLVWVDRCSTETGLVEKLRSLDRRPGPWPMDQPVDRGLDEVRVLLEKDPQGLIPPGGAFGDTSSRWENWSEQDLRAEGCLTVWDWLRERYQGAMPAYVMGMCPSGRLQDVLGFDSTMVGFLEAPEIIHEVSRLGMPRNRAHWKAVRKAGVGLVQVSEYTWGGLISPEVYGEFIAPYTRELIDFYHDIGFKVLLYVMGNIHGVLDQIAAYPFDALAIEEGRKDYDLDVGEIRRRLGDERVLFGNVSCMQVVEGRPEEILAEVRRQIAVAGRSGRFVVSIGEPLPQGTPAERVRFFCDSTRLISGS